LLSYNALPHPSPTTILLFLSLHLSPFSFFFFNATATTEIYTLSLHDALPIFGPHGSRRRTLRRQNSTHTGSNQSCVLVRMSWRATARRGVSSCARCGIELATGMGKANCP